MKRYLDLTAVDFQRAGAAIAGWTTGDLAAVQQTMRDATADGRSTQSLLAILEATVQIAGVRENPDLLDALRADIAGYASKAAKKPEEN